MKTSAKEGSPMFVWSLKTAIFRTASSSLPRRSTSSEIFISIVEGQLECSWRVKLGSCGGEEERRRSEIAINQGVGLWVTH